MADLLMRNATDMADLKINNATELLNRLREDGFRIEPPINVDKIAEYLGITVETDFSLQDDQIVGEITFEEGDPIIRINPDENSYEPRRRFTLAHELGHYCLHSAVSRKGFKDSRKTMSRTDSYWDFYESEANNFAAQLLMPKDWILQIGNDVIDEFEEETGNTGMPQDEFINSMATKFDVSNKSMEYRLKNLKIIE